MREKVHFTHVKRLITKMASSQIFYSLDFGFSPG